MSEKPQQRPGRIFSKESIYLSLIRDMQRSRSIEVRPADDSGLGQRAQFGSELPQLPQR